MVSPTRITLVSVYKLAVQLADLTVRLACSGKQNVGLLLQAGSTCCTSSNCRCLHQPAHACCLPHAASYFVANLVFLAGVFSFAAVIGECKMGTCALALPWHAAVAAGCCVGIQLELVSACRGWSQLSGWPLAHATPNNTTLASACCAAEQSVTDPCHRYRF